MAYMVQNYVRLAPSWSTGAGAVRLARRRPRTVRGVGSLQSVADLIQQIEGWYPGSRSYRNNNPGNLRCANQAGMVGCDSGGYAIFSDYASGRAAEEGQISLDSSRGLSIAQFTAKYAPASDGNDPSGYAASIANAEGLSVGDPLSYALDSNSSGGLDLGSMFSSLVPSIPSIDSSSMAWIIGISAALFGAWLLND